MFITTIIFSPIFGKYINSIGSQNLFLYGTFLAGSTNVLFGFLQVTTARFKHFLESNFKTKLCFVELIKEQSNSAVPNLGYVKNHKWYARLSSV